MAHKTQKYPQN